MSNAGLSRRAFLQRSAALGIGSAFAGTLLSACGSGRDDPSPGATGGGAAGSGLVTTWAWQTETGGYPPVFQQAADRWIAAGEDRSYEYVLIEQTEIFTKFRTASAGGEPPDLIEMNWSGTYRDLVRADTLEPLDDLLGDLPAFFPAVMDSLKVDGTTYAIPMDVNTLTIAYNKDVFEELGLEVPSTHDELLALAKPLRAAGLQPLAIGLKDQWPAGDVWFAHMAYTDDSGQAIRQAESGGTSWDSEPFLRAAQTADRLRTEGLLADGAASLDVASSIALFGSGEAAMMYPAGNFLTKTLTEAAGGKFEYDLFPFPALAGSGETRATGGPAVIWSVPKKSDNRAGAKELIKYFTDAETNTALVKADFIPASPTDPSSNQQQLYQRMVSFQESAATRAIFVPEVYTELLNSMSAMLGGSAGPKDVVKQMQSAG